MKWRWLPNAITVLRMVMALPLLWLLLEGRYRSGFWLALAAGLSDAVDGYLAKRFGWRSVLGGILDPIADKLLLGVCFFGLWWQSRLPDWLLFVVLARDVVILIGALAWWRRAGGFKPAPSGLSKLNTALQIVLAAALLADAAIWRFAPVLLDAMMAATAVSALASGADYVVRYSLRALRSKP